METPVEDILNTPATVKAFGKEYKIKRFSLGQLTRAAEHLAPLGYLVRSAMTTMDDPALAGDLIAQTLSIAGPPALGLLSVATEEPIEWLEEQDPVEAFELLSFTVERNARYFFVPENRERLIAAATRIKTAMQTASGKSATSSAPVDTAH